jgi:hypothetical protein
MKNSEVGKIKHRIDQMFGLSTEEIDSNTEIEKEKLLKSFTKTVPQNTQLVYVFFTIYNKYF